MLLLRECIDRSIYPPHQAPLMGRLPMRDGSSELGRAQSLSSRKMVQRRISGHTQARSIGSTCLCVKYRMSISTPSHKFGG